jgi:hypothetical protein
MDERERRERERAAALISEITDVQHLRIITEEYVRLAERTSDGWVLEDALLDAVCASLFSELPYVFDLPREG